MPNATSFGRAKPKTSALNRARPIEAKPWPPLTNETPTSVQYGGMPYATIGLAAALTLIFLMEQACAAFPTLDGSVSHMSLEALGGLSGQLVFKEGQLWRIFTAPLLHLDWGHLIGNLIALGVVGFFLERSIGPRWFVAIFAIGAVGGAIASIVCNPPRILSVGASGAIMALMAFAIAIALENRGGELRQKILSILPKLVIPTLVPALWGSQGVDHGAHIGGGATGMIAAWAMLFVWPMNKQSPLHINLASQLCYGGAVASIFGFVMAGLAFPAYATRAAAFAPAVAMSDLTSGNYARSGELVLRYPDDPRVHYMRALYFLDRGQLYRAEEQLRVALSQKDAIEALGMSEEAIQGVLALVLFHERRTTAAMQAAQPVCAAEDEYTNKLRIELQQRQLCEER